MSRVVAAISWTHQSKSEFDSPKWGIPRSGFNTRSGSLRCTTPHVAAEGMVQKSAAIACAVRMKHADENSMSIELCPKLAEGGLFDLLHNRKSNF